MTQIKGRVPFSSGGNTKMKDSQPAQVDEVAARLRQEKEAALVHVPTHHEVNVYIDPYDAKAPWAILYSVEDVPEKGLLRQALILGFELRAAEVSTNPSKYLFSLPRNCVGHTAAAIKGLQLIRLLPGVGPTDWIWITCYNYDDREDPPPDPPASWPASR